MAKSGRAFSDRKKIETLTSAKNITVADCGTCFMADGSGYSADVTHTIPHPSQAGNGWWIKIIVATDVLDSGGDDMIVAVRADGNTDGSSTVNDLLACLEVCATDDDQGAQEADGHTFKLRGESKASTCVEIICDGSKHYVLAHTFVAEDFTVTNS